MENQTAKQKRLRNMIALVNRTHLAIHRCSGELVHMEEHCQPSMDKAILYTRKLGKSVARRHGVKLCGILRRPNLQL